MGDVVVYVVPLDTDFVAEPGAAQNALAIVTARDLPGAEFIEHEHISFLGGSGSFPEIHCDHCGFDLLSERHWTDAMDVAYNHDPQFGDLGFSCPSCQGRLSLLDYSLRSSSDHAFARCAVRWRQRQRADVVPAGVVGEIARALGTPVRALEVHV